MEFQFKGNFSLAHQLFYLDLVNINHALLLFMLPHQAFIIFFQFQFVESHLKEASLLTLFILIQLLIPHLIFPILFIIGLFQLIKLISHFLPSFIALILFKYPNHRRSKQVQPFCFFFLFIFQSF